MMSKREIKFRAWHNGEMWDMEKEGRNLLDPIDWEDVSYLCHILRKTVYPYFSYKQWQLMQFTGLHDKNGKEIYEGDVIDYPMFYDCMEKELAGRGFVQWDEEHYYIAKVYPNGEEGYLCSTWDMAKNNGGEVIGNIYENPELL